MGRKFYFKKNFKIDFLAKGNPWVYTQIVSPIDPVIGNIYINILFYYKDIDKFRIPVSLESFSCRSKYRVCVSWEQNSVLS